MFTLLRALSATSCVGSVAVLHRLERFGLAQHAANESRSCVAAQKPVARPQDARPPVCFLPHPKPRSLIDWLQPRLARANKLLAEDNKTLPESRAYLAADTGALICVVTAKRSVT